MLKGEAQEMILALAKENGGTITPTQVIEAAQSDNSPLHPYFTWDDTEAARKYREVEARVLIRSVRLVTSVHPLLSQTPAFVHNPRATPLAQYISVSTLMLDREAAAEAVSREFRQASAALRRARNISDALDIQMEISELLQSIDAVSERAVQVTA